MERKTEMRRLRRARDLTLADVQAGAGVPANYVSFIERGRFVPDAEQSAKLAAFFGKPIDVLLADAAQEAIA